MISAGDFRNGVTLEIDGNVVQILEFQHVKPGKGAAFVRTKLKNVINGGVVEKTFRPTEKFPAARIDREDMQYLYNDGDLFYFMNSETYEQIGINKDTIGDALKFVKENEVCKVCSCENYHFTERIGEDDIYFDYRLYPGAVTSGNAIKLLKFMKFPEEIVTEAKQQVTIEL